MDVGILPKFSVAEFLFVANNANVDFLVGICAVNDAGPNMGMTDRTVMRLVRKSLSADTTVKMDVKYLICTLRYVCETVEIGACMAEFAPTNATNHASNVRRHVIGIVRISSVLNCVGKRAIVLHAMNLVLKSFLAGKYINL